MRQWLTVKNSKATLFIFVAFIAILPALVSWCLPVILFNASAKDYVPTTLSLNDATMYWQQINSFAKASFSTGYSGREEDLARLPFIHFGWQNFIVYVYGIFATLLGWHLWSSAIWNPVMLFVALVFFMMVSRCTWKQVMLTGLLMVTFWPTLLYLPTMMAESFHYVLSVLSAAGFAYILNHENHKKKTRSWLTIAVLFIGTAARPSWGPLLFLAIFLLLERGERTSFIPAMFKGLVICAAAFGVFHFMMPATTSTTAAAGVIIGGKVSISHILSTFLTNIHHLSVGGPFRVLSRIIIFLLLVIAIVCSLICLEKNKSDLEEWIRSNPDWLIHSFNLTSIVILTLFAYTTENWGDYRIVFIYVLFSCLFSIARWKSLAMPIVLIACNMMLSPYFLEMYQIYRGLEFGYDKTELKRFEAEVAPHIQYESNADPWQNTVLYGGVTDYFPTELIGLPAGMGIRIVTDLDNLRFPINSRYLLLDQDFYDWFPFKEHLNLIAITSIGSLYHCSPVIEPNTEDKQERDKVFKQKRSRLAYVMYLKLNKMAQTLSTHGEYRKSLSYLKYILYVFPDNSFSPDVYYNIACIYSKMNDVDNSVDWLKKAIENGFNNYDLIKKDPDLANIRNTSYIDGLGITH